MKMERAGILQDKIGYRFRDRLLLEAALTHSSLGGEAENYERLEFLGDRVLGLAMAELLYRAFPEEVEGDLAKRLSALVRGRMLAQIASDIDLGTVLSMSDAERAAGGEANENTLADSMEALIGAIYLDSGLEECQRLVRDLWGESIKTMQEPPEDSKTALQEWAQARGLPLPAYEVTGRSGPDHAPTFTITVRVEGEEPASSQGQSRRAAEKKAARILLDRLRAAEQDI